MSWNYRVCHRPSVPGGGHQIHEVYYDDRGRIKFYSNNPISAFGDDKDELYEDFANMWKAFDEDVIDLDRLDRKLLRSFMDDNYPENGSKRDKKA